MTAVEPEWLAELGPMFFSIKADPPPNLSACLDGPSSIPSPSWPDPAILHGLGT